MLLGMFVKKILMKFSCLFLSFLFFVSSISQNAIINEIDADTDGVDTKEFIEIKTGAPYASLDGYMIVLFNGSNSGGDASYYNLELDGFNTDINGLFVLGATDVVPSADFELPLNTMQNGADAIGLYIADEEDMPIGTVATTTNLVDALVYDTNDADDTVLMNLLGINEQYNEDENDNKDFQSIQRDNDGFWYVADATPKQLNDGSGVILNGITITKDKDVYDEGETMIITVTTEQPIENDVNLDIDISNGNFNQADFTGSLSISLLHGTNNAQANITILQDGITEGDEFTSINILNLPSEFISNNNDVSAVIIDADFTVSGFGSPLNPTFSNVPNQMPDDYYSIIDGLAGDNLIQAIKNLISEEGVVRAHSYADAKAVLELTDQNPENSNEIWMLYTEMPRGKYLYQTGSSGEGKWNREHTFPRSRGDFFSIEEDDIPTGINQWWNTNADSLRHANSDVHGLRAADALENSLRGNNHYGQYSGPAGNSGSFKGDVARAVFFLDIRYNALNVVDGFSEIDGQLGDLSTLISWHQNDPPDDFEMNRNNIIYDWQRNRNPFIDYPELVDYVWGNLFGDVWNQPLSITQQSMQDVKVYPNPVSDKRLYILNPNLTSIKLELVDTHGRLIFNKVITDHSTEIEINSNSGLYFLKLSTNQHIKVEKIIVY